ncbi:THC0290_0291 family protein [Polaribacter cellanae]|uniref:Glutamate dehydrogenase n=1 Tax=Polaribacter cellanae TaxID=2818493 RepID=A0A975CNH4_9FLAO|nr:hypothetical protein [Polaribacter cellanae]QTE21909.1 hypothetical protein J3359_13960 [Polaribacter cellanae]
MKKPSTILFVIVFFLEIKAQHYTHDIGGFVGSTSLQTDYGERNDFGSELKNQGISFSVAHYLSFYNRTLRWDPNNVLHNYLMVKTSLQYLTKTKMKHHGIYASKQSYAGEQLRSMKGTVRMINLGVHLEYFLHSLEEFVYPYSDISFNPYFTFGFEYSFFNNTVTSDLGDWQNDITVFPEKYQKKGHIEVGANESFVFSIGFGTRYKLTKNIDLATQINYQYFFSDKVDGLQAAVFENKNNEWALNIQVGLIYHLNFSLPLFY